MTTLAPCGTDAAYRRHHRRGEDIDHACRQAHRQTQRKPEPPVDRCRVTVWKPLSDLGTYARRCGVPAVDVAPVGPVCGKHAADAERLR